VCRGPEAGENASRRRSARNRRCRPAPGDWSRAVPARVAGRARSAVRRTAR
jgi:hypothetical protein